MAVDTGRRSEWLSFTDEESRELSNAYLKLLRRFVITGFVTVILILNLLALGAALDPAEVDEIAQMFDLIVMQASPHEVLVWILLAWTFWPLGQFAWRWASRRRGDRE